MWAVYMHKNKINGKVYIGITGQVPSYRWGKNGNGYKPSIFRSAVDKYGWENFEHIILYEGLTQEEAEQKEIYLIEKYKSTNRHYGYNSALGGNVNYGFTFKHSPETIEKMKNTRRGRPKTAEQRDAISKLHRGKTLSNDTREKISATYIKNHGVMVDQYTIDGTFVKRWDSISTASRQLNICHSTIIWCCKGRQKTTHGTTFRYANMPF